MELLEALEMAVRAQDIVKHVDKSKSSVYKEINGLMKLGMVQKLAYKKDGTRFTVVYYELKDQE